MKALLLSLFTFASLLTITAEARGTGYVPCASQDKRLQKCPANGVVEDVYLYERDSSSACIKGFSFGIGRDGRSIWTDHGCRGTFEVVYSRRGGGFDRDVFVTCRSLGGAWRDVGRIGLNEITTVTAPSGQSVWVVGNCRRGGDCSIKLNCFPNEIGGATDFRDKALCERYAGAQMPWKSFSRGNGNYLSYCEAR